jgi:hypothetical protein
MAWTAPRTWVTGEVVTAAQMNTHLRDNLLEVGAHVRKYKLANQAFTGTTFADVNDLFVPIGANEVWLFDVWLKHIANAANDVKYAWSMPSGYDTDSFWGGFFETTSGILASDHGEVSAARPINVTSATPMIARFSGTLINGSTPGTAKLQAAENSGSASVTVYKGSYLLAHRAA